MKLLLLFLLALVIFTVCPWITMLALNYLLGLSIVYSFKTWAAIVWMSVVFGGGSAAVSRS